MNERRTAIDPGGKTHLHPDHGEIHLARAFDDLDAILGIEKEGVEQGREKALREMVRLDGILSSPVTASSLDDLRAQFPSVEPFGTGFASDDGHAHIIFDRHGREIQLSYYKKSNESQSIEIATYERYTTEYDNAGYVAREWHMAPFPPYPNLPHGFLHVMRYKHLSKNKRRISKVEVTPLRKRGLIDPGEAYGRPHVLDFRLVNSNL